jgi:hypothetical protein
MLAALSSFPCAPTCGCRRDSRSTLDANDVAVLTHVFNYLSRLYMYDTDLLWFLNRLIDGPGKHVTHARLAWLLSVPVQVLKPDMVLFGRVCHTLAAEAVLSCFEPAFTKLLDLGACPMTGAVHVLAPKWSPGCDTFVLDPQHRLWAPLEMVWGTAGWSASMERAFLAAGARGLRHVLYTARNTVENQWARWHGRVARRAWMSL